MADLSEFSVEDFDIASFINRASSRHLEASADQPDSSSSGLDKILSELEMRLQLTAEDIESSLHDLSMQALRRIPYAVQEIYRLKGDVQGMQDRLGGLTSDISRDAQQAKGAVSGLVQLDRAKRNMEAACSTLREATELNGLFIKVEQVFAEGDLPRVAEMLSSMRKSLNLVGDVPEFRSGREKLKALEDRLQSQVEGSLGEALSVKGADAMAKEETIGRLCTLLLAVDRLSTVESLYCSSRLSFIKTAWEEMVVASGVPNAVHGLNRFLSWLPSFIEQEAAWCIRVLPEHHLRIILASSRFSSAWISDRLKDHLNMLIGTASKLSTMHLAPPAAFSLLVGLQRDLSSVASTLSAVLRLADGPIRKDILLLVFAPIEERVLSYSSIEDAVLSSSMPSSTPTTSVTPSSDGKKGAEEVVAMILVQSKAAFTAMHQAIERCLLFTGGTELPSLLRVMDKELSGIVARMQVQVKSLQDHHALSFNSKGGEGSFDEEEEVASTLKLLLSHADLSSRLLSLEAEIRTTVSSAVLKMEAAAADQGQGSSDPVSLRLSAPERIARVRKLLTSLGLSKGATDDEASKPTAAFLALPLSSSAAASLHVAIEAVLLDALLSKVKVHLSALPSLNEWRAQGQGLHSSQVTLPSFHAYPLAYITTIGEYLMTVPQQLEVLMSAEEGSGLDSQVEELAADWLDKVVSGAASLFAEAIARIPDLGAQGAAQLTADVEYFCNVQSALHGQPNPGLLAAQLLASLPQEQFVDSARGIVGEGGAGGGGAAPEAEAMVKALAKMRRINLSTTSSSSA